MKKNTQVTRDLRAEQRQQNLEKRAQSGKKLSRTQRRQLQTLRSQQKARQQRALKPNQDQNLQGQNQQRNLRQQNTQTRQSRRAARSPRVTPQAAAQGRFSSRFKNNRRFDRGERVAAREAWRHGRRAHFVAWRGPVFWPYAYSDIFEYTFWPQAYDDGYWDYAYDDFVDSIYWASGGPLDDSYIESAPVGGTAAPRRNAAGNATRVTTAAIAQQCKEPGNGITAWPFAQIEGAVRPNDEQRGLLQDVKDAAAQAANAFKETCSTDFAMTPPGRLKGMISRLQATLDAVRIVRPPLDKFYNALNDEQKARFNALGPDLGQDQAKAANSETQGRGGQDQQANNCPDAKPGLANLPIDRIDEIVAPTGEQEDALQRLSDATQKAVDGLQAACPNVIALTPVGRLETMEKRLEAMLTAAKTVLPALDEFYSSLNNEQKARFNTLGRESANAQ